MISAETLRYADEAKLQEHLKGLGVARIERSGENEFRLVLDSGQWFKFHDMTLLDDVRQQIAMAITTTGSDGAEIG